MFKNGSKFRILFLLLIFSLPLLPLFHSGLPITHDGQDHIARIANFYQSLSDGNIIPRWAGNLNWGYGHPILSFLYPLPSYSASFFHFLNFSYIDSLKIVFGLSFVASGIAMYLWVRNFLDENSAILASILYLYAPYRFVDLYVRGAIGEHVAFVFLPLILYFLLKFYKTENEKREVWYGLGLSFSVAGLILSHNAISLMFFPFVGFYMLSLWSKNNFFGKFFLTSLAYLILGFLLSSFFWVPAFFEGKYTLRDIVTGGEIFSRFVGFKDLVYGQWSYGITGQFTTQIGAVGILALILSPLIFKRLFGKERKKAFFVLGTVAYAIFGIILMLNFSKPIYETITILEKFQFPWRFLSIVIFATAVLGGIGLSVVKNPKIRMVLLVLFSLLAIIPTISFWRANGYLQKPDSFYEKVYYGTTDTGESSPVWSVRFMEREPKLRIEIVEGEAEIMQTQRTSTRHSYQIVSASGARIKENTLYFPGWKVYVDGKENKKVEFQDARYRGIITFYVERGRHKVDVVFEETKLRFAANMVSLISIVLVFMLIFVIVKAKWKII